ncbi:MFS transporter [Mucilaginibacter sp.]|uniref:MFS transporter n=1 Tax=Mucilaginibacter sp. TaxID=1882438 RepID=UPI00374CC025
MFLVMTGLGITLPVLPFYIEKLLLSGSILSDKVSLDVGLITGSFPLTQFLFSSYLGSLSDKIGRRPLILAGIAGFSVSTFLFSLGGSVMLLYASRLSAGIFTAGFVTASGAYIADLTSKEQRGKNMAVLSSIAGLGAVAGPLLGNLLKVNIKLNLFFGQLKLDKFSTPFVISSLLALVVLILYAILLPESHKVYRKVVKRPIAKAKIQLIPNWKLLNRTFMSLLAFSFISQLALAMFEGTFALHSQRLFSFGPQQLSVVFIVCGSLMGFLQLGPVAWLIDKKGENILLPFGFLFLGIGIFMLTTSRTMEWILIYVAFISTGMAILTPTLASLITKDSEKGHGASLGIFSSVNSLGQVTGVVTGGVIMIWSNHIAYWSVAVVLLGAAYLVLPKNRLLVLKS